MKKNNKKYYFFINKINQIALFTAVFLFVFLSMSNISQASYYRHPFVKIYDNQNNNYQEIDNFFAYGEGFKGGVNIAAADLGKDNNSEIITAPGIGGGPQVRIFDKNGNFLRDFWAYEKNMDKGVNLALGDLNNDGINEIITAPKYGGGPQVRVFDSFGRAKFTNGFYAYDRNFSGGVNIASCDVTGDGKAEIITAPGIGGGPQVRVFDAKGNWLGRDFWPFLENFHGGVNVACGNVDGGAESEIIMSVQSQEETWIKVYKFNEERTILGYFKAWPDGVETGVNIASGDTNGDGYDEVVAAIAGFAGPQVKIFKAHGEEVHPGFFAFEEDFRGGVNLAVSNLDNDKAEEIIVAPSRPKPEGRTDLAKYVLVDLSEQRLYAYESGYLENTFLISSGLVGPTPIGNFSVQRKIYSHLYEGEDYYLPNTLYNMQFLPSYYLHGAYWHNNFGHPMSHGCVNIAYPDAAWLYDWTEVGTPVIIQY